VTFSDYININFNCHCQQVSICSYWILILLQVFLYFFRMCCQFVTT
jgi:hypothetical protein